MDSSKRRLPLIVFRSIMKQGFRFATTKVEYCNGLGRTAAQTYNTKLINKCVENPTQSFYNSAYVCISNACAHTWGLRNQSTAYNFRPSRTHETYLKWTLNNLASYANASLDLHPNFSSISLHFLLLNSNALPAVQSNGGGPRGRSLREGREGSARAASNSTPLASFVDVGGGVVRSFFRPLARSLPPSLATSGLSRLPPLAGCHLP